MLARYLLSLCVRLSDRLSHAGIVSKRLHVGSGKQRHVIAQFSDANNLWWVTPYSPEICAHSDPPPFEHHDFDKYLLIVHQP